MTEMFQNVTGVMVAQLCKFSGKIVNLKWVTFMVYKLYLNKPVGEMD